MPPGHSAGRTVFLRSRVNRKVTELYTALRKDVSAQASGQTSESHHDAVLAFCEYKLRLRAWDVRASKVKAGAVS